MRLYYYRDPLGNFGDDLNPWIWERVFPGAFRAEDSDDLFIGIGTILDSRVPAAPRKTVMGSGTGYHPPPTLDERWRIHFVRGPLTAAALGLEPTAAITDPAILLAHFFPESTGAGKAMFMPHHRSVPFLDWPVLCAAAGLEYMDPTRPVEDIMAAFSRASLVVAEAMHGAIVADAVRVPWIPVQIFPGFNEFKWRDWFQSMGVESGIEVAPPAHDGFARLWVRHLGRRVRGIRATGKLGTWVGKSPGRWSLARNTSAARGELVRALVRIKAGEPRLSDPKFHARRLDQVREMLATFSAERRIPLAL